MKQSLQLLSSFVVLTIILEKSNVEIINLSLYVEGFLFFMNVCVASPLTLGINRKIQVFDAAAVRWLVQFSHHCCGAE